jgi:hydrogenase maturation protease
MPPHHTLILGVGNRYRSDDGIGFFMIAYLKSQGFNQADLLDGGTDGLALLDIIQKYSKVIIIDAIDANQPPGTVTVFSPHDAKIKFQGDALSTHGFGLAEMLALADVLSIKTEIIIIGIQPASLEFREGLSPIVATQVQKIYDLSRQIAVTY